MSKRRVRTGRRLYGGDTGLSLAEALDESPIYAAEHVSDEVRPDAVRSLESSDTDRRLYGVAQSSARETTQALEGMPIRVLVVDDHAVLRDGIAALLGLENGIEIVGQAENGKEAVDMVSRESPDVVLMDISMPVMDGIEATRAIKENGFPGRVLVLSQYDEEPMLAACMEAGASGFLPKKYAGPLLVDGIRTVRRGEDFYIPLTARCTV